MFQASIVLAVTDSALQRKRASAKGQVYTLRAALDIAVCLQASLGDDAEASIQIMKQGGVPEPCPKGEDEEKRE